MRSALAPNAIARLQQSSASDDGNSVWSVVLRAKCDRRTRYSPDHDGTLGGGTLISIDKCTMGHPGKYLTASARTKLAGEPECALPTEWFGPQDSTVTALQSRGHDINDSKSTDANGLRSRRSPSRCCAGTSRGGSSQRVFRFEAFSRRVAPSLDAVLA